MNVTVQEHGQTKSGNPKVRANGKWYFLARDIGAPPAVGATVEIRTGSFTMGEPPKVFETIEAWRPAGQVQPTVAQPSYAPPNQQYAAQTSARPAKQEPVDEYIDEASLRYISNVVGQAIAAKTIVEPGQILAWHLAAKASLKNQSAPVPFDDRIPH